MALRITRRSSFKADSRARSRLPVTMGATRLASKATQAKTTSSSTRVKPFSLLPVMNPAPVDRLFVALAVHVIDVLPAPMQGVRRVLVRPEPPHLLPAFAEGVGRDAAQVAAGLGDG